MNVLHVTSQYPNMNFVNAGIFIQKVIHNLSNYTEFDYSVFIPVKIYSKNLRFKALNLYKRDFFHEPAIPVFKSFYAPFFGIYRLSYMNAYLAWFFCKRYLIKLIKQQGILLLHAHTANPEGYLAYKVSRMLKIPYIMHLHGRDIQEYHTFPDAEKKITRMVYANANHIICNSTKTQSLLKSEMGIHNNSEIISFGINNIVKRKNYDLNSPVRLISVGNLIEIKGIQYVLDALKDLKGKIDFFYTIVGDGVLYEYLKNKVQEYGLDKDVKFQGRINNPAVLKLMQEQDIFILPSYEEAFGVVYLEALSRGCSVIGVRGQGCEDINKYGKCIYLTEPRSAESIKTTIADILNNSEKRMNNIKKGFEVLKNYYSWKIISKRIENLYNSAINITGY